MLCSRPIHLGAVMQSGRNRPSHGQTACRTYAATKLPQKATTPCCQKQRHCRIQVFASSQGTTAPEGQVSSALMASMQQKITEALEASYVQVKDVYGDGRHVSIDVVSKQFEGKSSVHRQRLVYKVCSLTPVVHPAIGLSCTLVGVSYFTPSSSLVSRYGSHDFVRAGLLQTDHSAICRLHCLAAQ